MTTNYACIYSFIDFQVTHWHSPRFHAYFPTANSYPAIVADILSGAIACIGFSWVSYKIKLLLFNLWPKNYVPLCWKFKRNLDNSMYMRCAYKIIRLKLLQNLSLLCL